MAWDAAEHRTVLPLSWLEQTLTDFTIQNTPDTTLDVTEAFFIETDLLVSPDLSSRLYSPLVRVTVSPCARPMEDMHLSQPYPGSHGCLAQAVAVHASSSGSPHFRPLNVGITLASLSLGAFAQKQGATFIPLELS